MPPPRTESIRKEKNHCTGRTEAILPIPPLSVRQVTVLKQLRFQQGAQTGLGVFLHSEFPEALALY